MNELNIKELVTVALVTYKERWKTLLLISLFSTIISVSVGMIGIIANTMEFSLIQLLLSLTNLALMIISMYFTMRLSVALIIASKASLCNEDIVISSAYKKAKPLTWRYIGFTILFGLILMIPIALVMIGTVFGGILNIEFPSRVVLIILGSVPAIYLYTNFHFSLFIAALYPNESSVFAYSKKLVNGNFVKVFIIMMIPLIITIPVIASNIIFNISQSGVYIQLGVSVLRAIPDIIIMPFSILLSLETMKRLETINSVKEEEVG